MDWQTEVFGRLDGNFHQEGFNPGDSEDKESSQIQSLLEGMNWSFNLDFYFPRRRQEKDIDSYESREKIKMIHLLARHGARWIPEDQRDINSARRSLLKMRPDYTMEFIRIMSGYNICERETIEGLINTPAMCTLLSKHLRRVNKLMEAFQAPTPLQC